MGLSLSDETQSKLNFVYGDSTLGANFNTGLTTEALIGLCRLGFAVFHYKHLSWASCYTLFVAAAFIFIYYYLKHDFPPKMRLKNKYS